MMSGVKRRSRFTLLRLLILSLLRRQKSRIAQNYGPLIGTVFAVIARGTATQYERIEKAILYGGDDEAVAFRDAVTNECNMTAVAGAIIAQVAITGLSLPNLSSTHWIARTFLLLAVVSGCLSVYYACILHRIVGKLYRPDQIRNWLRLPPPTDTEEEINVFRPSLAAVLIVGAPFIMIKFSIILFLLGLIVYQGLIWTRGLDPNGGIGDSRAVFICFMVGTSICVIFFVGIFYSKFVENMLRAGEIDIDEIKGLEKPRKESSMKQENHSAADENCVASPQVSQPVTVTALSALAKALEAASQAHLQCAEADRQAAVEYTRAANSQAR
ncbi:hypothetical protein N7G274_004809 [Stereocaulon virgatum]|uniref:Uncharacterized protein n=1 Tax=Stereocaulon virgatum TaxID=373712 RepID=A0ABR4A978_9LECA